MGDPLSAAAFLALTAASFAGSFLTAALGIGGGVFVLTIMASLLPPAALIPVHGLVQLGSNAFRTFLLRAHIHWAPFAGFLGGSVLGAGLGGLIAVDIPPELLRIAVGLFVLWSVLSRPPAALTRLAPAAGALSSFLTMFVGATGPFVTAWVKTLALPRQAHVATTASLMTLQHGLKIAVFGLLGFAFAPWAPLIAAMIAAGFAGTYAGKQLLDRLSERHFRRALNLLLTGLALRLIWMGLAPLLG